MCKDQKNYLTKYSFLSVFFLPLSTEFESYDLSWRQDGHSLKT
jgi:hypothetical protein